MTWTPPAVKTFIDSSMVTFFNASATAPVEDWAEGFMGASNPGAPVVNSLVAQLGAAFGDTAAFNTLYGSLSDTAFLNAISNNLTGAPLDAALQASFTSILTSIEGQNNPATGHLYTVNEARGVTAAILTVGFLGTEDADVAHTPYHAQWQTAENKTAVSSDYAAASATSTFLVPHAESATDHGWMAAQTILNGITSDHATVTTADAHIAAMVHAGNITPLVHDGALPNAIGLV